jgi:hypothetical protein
MHMLKQRPGPSCEEGWKFQKDELVAGACGLRETSRNASLNEVFVARRFLS